MADRVGGLWSGLQFDDDARMISSERDNLRQQQLPDIDCARQADSPGQGDAIWAYSLDHFSERPFHRFGRAQHGKGDTSEVALLRLLTPLAKLWTGKLAVAICSEAIECLGGAGYIEDSGLPQLLRDAQVLPIWEGTTNVLSLDVLRVLRNPAALVAWRSAFDALLLQAEETSLQPATSALRTSAGELLSRMNAL